jgi:hypothetical protein
MVFIDSISGLFLDGCARVGADESLTFYCAVLAPSNQTLGKKSRAKKSAADVAAQNPPKEEGGGDKPWNRFKPASEFRTDSIMQSRVVQCKQILCVAA